MQILDKEKVAYVVGGRSFIVPLAKRCREVMADGYDATNPLEYKRLIEKCRHMMSSNQEGKI